MENSVSWLSALTKITVIFWTGKIKPITTCSRISQVVIKTTYFLDQVVETESGRESVLKEAQNLQRRYAELEEELRLKEKDFQMALEEARGAERKIVEKLRMTEVTLENCNSELGDMKLKLSAAEGRINGLEAQLAQVEGMVILNKNQVDIERVLIDLGQKWRRKTKKQYNIFLMISQLYFS